MLTGCSVSDVIKLYCSVSISLSYNYSVSVLLLVGVTRSNSESVTGYVSSAFVMQKQNRTVAITTFSINLLFSS